MYNLIKLQRDGEAAQSSGNVSEDISLKAIKWAATNNVRRSGEFWEKDNSILAYTDKTLVEEFHKSLIVSQFPAETL